MYSRMLRLGICCILLGIVNAAHAQAVTPITANNIHQITELQVIETGSTAFVPRLSRDGSRAALGPWGVEGSGREGAIRVLDTGTGDEVNSFVYYTFDPRMPDRYYDSVPRTIALSPDGVYLAAAGEGPGLLIIWDVESGEEVLVNMTGQGLVYDLSFNIDGQFLAMSGSSGLIESSPHNFVNADYAFVLFSFGLYTIGEYVTLSPDGRYSLVGSNAFGAGDLVSIFDMASWQFDSASPILAVDNLELMFEIEDDAIIDPFAFHPTETQIVVYDTTGHVEIWDFIANARLYSLQITDVTAIAFSTDGQILAAGNQDGEIHLWDLTHIVGEDDTLIASDVILHGHTGWADITFTPDGRLVSGSNDGTIRHWGIDDSSEYSAR